MAEDLFAWMDRTQGGFDTPTYRRLLGAANPFKEGDAAQGIAASDEGERAHARSLIAATAIARVLAAPVFVDEVSTFGDSVVDPAARAPIAAMTVGELRAFLLDRPEADIKAVMPGLSSDLIAIVVKLMSNADLVAIGQKVFNPLPGSAVGARGYLGARIQPNSPTDHPEDIQLQVFDGFAYAVGDTVLGTNPVSSEVAPVAAVEAALQEVLRVFGLEDILPHCVLAHVDVQDAVEREFPGTTALWFQSLAGVDDANRTFDIDVAKMRAHAATRTGRFGMYFETGQGADGTNGHGKGFDMVIHESRKYGFARALKRDMAEARRAAGVPGEPWVQVNDVAGFIGPEVFRTQEQLVRVCLEDTVMGKLHGLTIGLDICSTLHMDVSLDDLTTCQEQILPANPAYLMALPTRNDPMLSYLTTSFQDHVRARHRFGYKVDDRMWAFFQRLGVIDAKGEPTEHFGDPAWVYLQFQRAKGDPRTQAAILAEAEVKIAAAKARGVPLARGHGAMPWDLDPALDAEVRALYADAKACLHAELPGDFCVAGEVRAGTRSRDRAEYILHPPTGERLDDASIARIGADDDDSDVQLVISDGLDALALTDAGHLGPFLAALPGALAQRGLRLGPHPIVLQRGRVRAGYQVGELRFAGRAPGRVSSVVHLIGERPGNGHHTYSAYVTAAPTAWWATPATVDHNHTRVVANIADTALPPDVAAHDAARILGELYEGLSLASPSSNSPSPNSKSWSPL